MTRRARNWSTPLAWIVAVAGVLLLLFPLGFPNYDTIYALVWGRELAHGLGLDFGAALPPTPHPLADLFGLATAPLGDGAVDATMLVAYVALGLVGYLVYRLGSLWFDRPIGAAAALIVLTRAPYLSNGLRAYVDLPFIALCLAALVLVTRDFPRGGGQPALLSESEPGSAPDRTAEAAGGGKPAADDPPGRQTDWQVLSLLALAGLLRPEAWLFSLAYLAYLALGPERPARSHRRERAQAVSGDPGHEGAGGELHPDRGEGAAEGPRPRDGATGAPDGPEREEPTGDRLGLEEEMRTSLERADTQIACLIRPAIVRAREVLISSLVRARGILVSPRGAALIALALAAPILWALFDWITAGSPTYSLTGTRETVETLARQTGPVDLVLYGPRRLGEVLQWPGMVGAAGGVAFVLALMRRGGDALPRARGGAPRAAIGIVAAGVALAAFALLACAGLAIIPRYTMLAAAVLAVFAAAALLGWRLLDRGHPWRRAWQALAVLVALMFLAWGPNQYDLLNRVDVDLTNQARIEDDLNDLADSGAFEPLCLPISVPNHRAVPRLAFDLDVEPSRIVSSSEQRQPSRGYFLEPASPFVVHNFVLDPNDPARFETAVPPGFRRVAADDSWILYRRCRPGGSR